MIPFQMAHALNVGLGCVEHSMKASLAYVFPSDVSYQLLWCEKQSWSVLLRLRLELQIKLMIRNRLMRFTVCVENDLNSNDFHLHNRRLPACSGRNFGIHSARKGKFFLSLNGFLFEAHDPRYKLSPT